MVSKREYKAVESTLRSWSFLRDYRENGKAFDDVLRAVITTLEEEAPLDTAYDPYIGILADAYLSADVFIEAADNKYYLLSQSYPVMARKLAIFVLQNNWGLI